MKYRTKLYLSFFLVALLSTCLGIWLFYREGRDQYFNVMRSKVLSIAATSAAMLDGQNLGPLRNTKDTNDPLYQKLVRELRNIRNANRREDVDVHFVYAVSPSPTNPEQLVFIGDADENPEPLGEVYVYDDAYDILSNEDFPFASRKFISDQWGLWLSGFAPVFDSQGTYSASVGVDINAHIILSRLNKLMSFGEFALLASMALAGILAFILARFSSKSLNQILKGVEEIERGDFDVRIPMQTHDEYANLASAIEHMGQGLKERERLKLSFASYVSRHVMEKILKNDTPLRLEGERKKITVMFTDIRDFSKLAETLPAEEVVALLNEYFAKMFDIIFDGGGTLDKFVGDSIMVEFGAPLDDPEQEKHAIETALKMQHTLSKLQADWKDQGKPYIEMGIGIHTGHAVVGNVGSERRMEYTAIGDTVNVASRLEQATKALLKPILVSETTLQGAGDHFETESLGEMELHGRTEKIKVFAVFSTKKK